MNGKLVTLLVAVQLVCGQHSPNSLQSAIEALHRHHDILSSRHHEPHEHNRHEADYYGEEAMDPYERAAELQQQGQLNRAIAEYLISEDERQRYEDEERYMDEDLEGGFEARKRSVFRERDEPHKSVFREREYASLQPDLGQEFLEEMERDRLAQEEEEYRHSMRRLWDKFQQQENSLERKLFEEEEGNENDLEDGDDDEERKKKRSFDLDDRKKRYGFLPAHFGPMPAKRRDYPLLPWLTNDDDKRKKRFPVRKRSAKPMPEGPNAAGTSSKVAQDLESLFGSDDKKKKRSTDEVSADKKAPVEEHKIEKKSIHDPEDEEDEDEQEGEDDHEHDHDHEHEDDHHHDHDHEDDSEEDSEERKKKRDVSLKSAPEVVKDDQIIPGDLSDFKKKKDVNWDKYFGYDRRKKRTNGKYQSMMGHAPHAEAEDEDEDDEDKKKKKKKRMSPEKLDSMDEKLKNIEDLIIEETVKYTGAHEGISSPEEIQRLKDHVIGRLATAYSLKKMRKALDELRENVDTERHLLHNEIEPSRDSGEEEDDDGEDDDKKKKRKRVAVKKSPEHGPIHNQHVDFDEEKRKKKRKRNGFELEQAIEENECPLLVAIEKRCRGVDAISGDIHQELLPVCAAHQLCYLCGTSQKNCDLQYLSDSNAVCGPNLECESAARSALMILHGAPGPHFGPRECARNQCLYNAIREFDKK